MAGNVRLQRGAHLAIQNKFRTVSLGFMPYLPETQRYRMELDASAQVLEQNKKGYWTLGPRSFPGGSEESLMAGPNGTYGWLTRRAAYNAGIYKGIGAAATSGRLSTLNTYSREEAAVGVADQISLGKESGIIAKELHALIEDRTGNVYERTFARHDMNELELLMVSRGIGTQAGDVDIGAARLRPRDVFKNAQDPSQGLMDNIKELSTQNFDFYPEEIPRVMAALKSVKDMPAGLINRVGGVEIHGGGIRDPDTNEFQKMGQWDEKLESDVRGWVDPKADIQTKFKTRIQEDVDEINEDIRDLVEGMAGRVTTMRDKGWNPKGSLEKVTFGSKLEEFKKRRGYSFYKGNQAKASAFTGAWMLLGETADGWIKKEGRRLMSRGKEIMDRNLKAFRAKTRQPVRKLMLEHVNLPNGNIGIFILGWETDEGTQTRLTREMPVGMPAVPQLKVYGTFVLNHSTLAGFVKQWAAEKVFNTTVAELGATHAELSQMSADEATMSPARIKWLGHVQEATFETCLRYGIRITIGEAGGAPGIIGLTPTGIAEGLERKIHDLLSSQGVANEVTQFYDSMMTKSNLLSDAWKMKVPKGKHGARMSQEWTFGDGKQTGPPGGPHKRYLGIWGPTGDATGKYNNWKDVQRRIGHNVSISPFLVARRAGVGQFIGSLGKRKLA